MIIEEIQKIKDIIELFDKQQQLDILKICISENVNFSENSNGVFINLSNINENVMNKFNEYIDFIKSQNLKLNYIEDEKKKIENNYFGNVTE
tara:strand:+ start:134 stop:409 length:276 start_codon:yes stop_codon:yes gene_type:complete